MMMNSFVGGRREEQVSIPEDAIPELDMSIKSDSISTEYFADPGSNGIKLRGPTYLQDKKKVQAWPMHGMWSDTINTKFIANTSSAALG